MKIKQRKRKGIIRFVQSFKSINLHECVCVYVATIEELHANNMAMGLKALPLNPMKYCGCKVLMFSVI